MNYSSKLNELYSAVYAPKLLPQDLLENLKLKNYVSVNFTTENNLTLATTKCILQDGSIAEYVYTFKDLMLFRLEHVSNDKPSIIIYDRETEIIKMKSELVLQLKLSNVS